jgi:hypothetical protein
MINIIKHSNKENQCNLINQGCKEQQALNDKGKKKKFYQNKKKSRKETTIYKYEILSKENVPPVANIINLKAVKISPFCFQLTTNDFNYTKKNQIIHDSLISSLVKDFEMQSILDENSYTTDKMLENHKLKVNAYYEDVKRIETLKWLETRSAEERAQYLERTKYYK